eukprot:jgi/Botrbrau1/57/Bobra.0022s0051.1
MTFLKGSCCAIQALVLPTQPPGVETEDLLCSDPGKWCAVRRGFTLYSKYLCIIHYIAVGKMHKPRDIWSGLGGGDSRACEHGKLCWWLVEAVQVCRPHCLPGLQCAHVSHGGMLQAQLNFPRPDSCCMSSNVSIGRRYTPVRVRVS